VPVTDEASRHAPGGGASRHRPPIESIVAQHAEEGAALRHSRSTLVRAPHITLRQLRRHDDRIAAHLDGLVVAGPYGLETCARAMEHPGTGEAFTLAFVATAARDARTLQRLLALASALPPVRRGVVSALAWCPPGQLANLLQRLLEDPAQRLLALDACRLLGLDGGDVLVGALRDASPIVRATAARAAGELGRTDTLDALIGLSAAEDAQLAYWAARSALLLGDRHDSVRCLTRIAEGDLGSISDSALAIVLISSEMAKGRDVVRGVARAGARDVRRERRVIRACGWLGDADSVPWLIQRMSDPAVARVAAEAMGLITGIDWSVPGRELTRSASDAGEDDEPAESVGDESLPRPDAAGADAWWTENAVRMPRGSQSFLGNTPDPSVCRQALRNALQRQRSVAALRLKLLQPEEMLFNVRAPAWAQQASLGGA